MLNNYLGHTDREEDWFQGFQSTSNGIQKRLS